MEGKNSLMANQGRESGYSVLITMRTPSSIIARLKHYRVQGTPWQSCGQDSTLAIAQGLVSIPLQGTKFWQATRPGQKQKKKLQSPCGSIASLHDSRNKQVQKQKHKAALFPCKEMPPKQEEKGKLCIDNVQSLLRIHNLRLPKT